MREEKLGRGDIGGEEEKRIKIWGEIKQEWS